MPRNRLHLLSVARQLIAEQGADKLTMDGLAERAGLGKGTVFRRFGSRAGIFRGLLDEEERDFQAQVLSGPPPLGPGAAPLDRLVAYGRRAKAIRQRSGSRAAGRTSSSASAGRSAQTGVRSGLRGQAPLKPDDRPHQGMRPSAGG